jgi:hypothetical protein
MLAIDRLSLHVRAAAAPGRAERLAHRLRDAARAGVERARYALAPPGAPAYLFVERLALQCAVSSDWDDAAIGAEVARSLAAALERSFELPGTLSFRDRVELLAAFYSALADGCAWQRWWFDAFDGLRPLSASAALRTSVMNEAADGIAALARLTRSALASVLGVLTAGDAKRLLEWLAQRPASGAPAPFLLWPSSASLSPYGESEARWLDALIAAERTAAGAASGATLQILRDMVALRTAAAAVGAGRRPDFPSPLPVAPQARLHAMLSSLSLRASWVDLLSESEAHAIWQELASEAETSDGTAVQAATSVRAAAAVPESACTRLGGAFVLLKTLDWLGWPARWRRRLDAADADALVRSLALAVVARALEGRSAARALGDPALQIALGVERPLALLWTQRSAVRSALRETHAGARLTPIARQLLAEFARRVPGLADASRGYLRRNALELSAAIERRDARCVVRLGRAPLDVLLTLSGARRGAIALPGLHLELREADA